MKQLDKLSKKLKGSILIIGYSDENKLVLNFKSNDNIDKIYTLNNTNPNSIFSRNKSKKRLNGNKKINIKKLRKELKKENFDYILCDFEIIMPFFRSFVKNSILIAKKKVYIYLKNDDYDIEEVKRRYVRYNLDCILENEKKEYLYEIDTSNAKISFFKSCVYYIRDLFYDFFEFIGNIIIG